MDETIFDFIKREENAYRALPITVVDGYEWQMYEHIRLSILYKNSQFSEGNGKVERDGKPFKNITRPLLNLQHRAEGFDVKDISLFVNDPDQYYKSFLIKKFHDPWARRNGLDTFIDDLVESYTDLGGALAQKDASSPRPVIRPLQTLAFCDQTDILSGPFAFKLFYSPDQLKDMEANHWGDAKYGATATIDEVIKLAKNVKKEAMNPGKQTRTPGKYIEVYEIHGVLPAEWLQNDNENDDANESAAEENAENQFIRQMQIVTFYHDENNNKKGVILFKGKERPDVFKFIARDPIHGRALGMGGAEELFDPQVWTNYDQIRIKDMLDAASKVILKTTDPAVAARHPSGLKDLDNLEIIELDKNTDINQLDTVPRSLALFERNVAEWDAHAKEIASATPALLGSAPTNHTSFAFQKLVVQQATALHDYRRGKLATFMDEIYRDWIIPYIAKEVANGQKFLAELSVEELQQVADSLVQCEVNDTIKEKILNGETIDPNEVEALKQKVKEDFMKGGNKRFIEILKGELADAPIEVQTDIAGKQKDLVQLSTQLTGIFRQIIAAPQILNDPRMAKIFNMILESSGFSPISFYMPPQPEQDNGPATKVSESINFKDLPPDGKVQMAKQAGININISPPAPPGAPPKTPVAA